MQPRGAKGLRQFLDAEQQRDWMEGKIDLPDADERPESLEQRFKYVARFEKLLRRPQAEEVLAILAALRRTLHPDPAPDRALLLVGLLPAVDLRQAARPGQCELDGAFHALCGRRGYPREIHRASFGFHHGPISHAGPIWTKRFSSNASTTPEDIGYFFPRGADIFVHQGPRLRLDPQIPRSRPRAARHSDVQSDPHEPGPERLPGEPLLQPGRPYAGRLSSRLSRQYEPIRLLSGSTTVVRHRRRGLDGKLPFRPLKTLPLMRTAAPIRGCEVALPAFLQFNGERHAVRLLDLSPGGAKLDCATNLSAGTAVVLDCGTLGRAAVVRWKSAGVLGICFDSELDAREVSALIKRSNALAARMKTRD